jgi:hypothetical protein
MSPAFNPLFRVKTSEPLSLRGVVPQNIPLPVLDGTVSDLPPTTELTLALRGVPLEEARRFVELANEWDNLNGRLGERQQALGQIFIPSFLEESATTKGFQKSKPPEGKEPKPENPSLLVISARDTLQHCRERELEITKQASEIPSIHQIAEFFKLSEEERGNLFLTANPDARIVDPNTNTDKDLDDSNLYDPMRSGEAFDQISDSGIQLKFAEVVANFRAGGYGLGEGRTDFSDALAKVLATSGMAAARFFRDAYYSVWFEQDPYLGSSQLLDIPEEQHLLLSLCRSHVGNDPMGDGIVADILPAFFDRENVPLLAGRPDGFIRLLSMMPVDANRFAEDINYIVTLLTQVFQETPNKELVNKLVLLIKAIEEEQRDTVLKSFAKNPQGVFQFLEHTKLSLTELGSSIADFSQISASGDEVILDILLRAFSKPDSMSTIKFLFGKERGFESLHRLLLSPESRAATASILLHTTNHPEQYGNTVLKMFLHGSAEVQKSLIEAIGSETVNLSLLDQLNRNKQPSKSPSSSRRLEHTSEFRQVLDLPLVRDDALLKGYFTTLAFRLPHAGPLVLEAFKQAISSEPFNERFLLVVKNRLLRRKYQEALTDPERHKQFIGKLHSLNTRHRLNPLPALFDAFIDGGASKLPSHLYVDSLKTDDDVTKTSINVPRNSTVVILHGPTLDAAGKHNLTQSTESSGITLKFIGIGDDLNDVRLPEDCIALFIVKGMPHGRYTPCVSWCKRNRIPVHLLPPSASMSSALRFLRNIRVVDGDI